MSDSQSTKISMDLDFLQTGPQTWDIALDTDAGQLTLSLGGKVMALDGQPLEVATTPEYAALYAHFADLVRVRRIDADVLPCKSWRTPSSAGGTWTSRRLPNRRDRGPYGAGIRRYICRKSGK
jgi:hypothetical protein